MTKAIPAFLAVALVVLAGCGPGHGEAGSSSPTDLIDGGKYTILLASDLDTLDPAKYSADTSTYLMSMLYDRPLGIDAKGNIVSGLADKWSVTPTSATLTFRKDVTCADGTPFTLQDAVNSFKRVQDPAVNAPRVGTYLGGPDFKISADPASNSLTIALSRPFGFLENGLAHYPQLTCSAGLAHPAGLAKTPSGTGPFTLASSSPGNSYVFKLRPDYRWGPSGATTAGTKGLPSEVQVQVVPDPTTRANLIRTGQANLAPFPGATSRQLSGVQGVKLTDQSPGTYELMLNQASGRPLADPATRKAVAQALDLSELAHVATEGVGKVATTLIAGEICAGDMTTSFPRADANAAKATTERLSRAGKPLKLVLLKSDANPATVEYLQQTFAKVGIAISVNTASAAESSTVQGSGGDWDLSINLFSAQYPSSVYPLFSGDGPPNGANFSHIDNSRYASMGAQARAVAGSASCGLWRQAEAALIAGNDILPVAQSGDKWATYRADFSYARPFIDPLSLRRYKD